jgi:cytochrome c-type biogenesis protein CcmE
MEKRSRNRLIVVSVFVLLVLAVLLYSAIGRGGSNLSYFKTVTEIKNDPSLIGKSVKVGGEVVPGSIKKKGTTVTFKIDDKKNTMSITYTGAVPSTFADKVQVIAEGTYTKAGLVEADSLVTKCPSKYSNEKIETK